ncbi:predicted protein [Sparassis crispa]|uniref:Uncharacterized protein n=1 Tax=Sparassis crispa TaxID=139825 RepID=A0A401GH72_9APHY|nr:predicted protein [Sparassis crispa]GBE81475.1 predicted protein [Sparassis crispa]
MRSTIAVSALLVAASAAPSLALPIAPASGSEALNWYKLGNAASTVGKTLLHLREEDALVARADAGSEAINWSSFHPTPFGPAVVREDALIARAAPAGSEAINWKKLGGFASTVGKTLLSLREDPIVARAFEDELLARADAGSEAINWGAAYLFHPLREVDPILARALEDELLARAGGSEAINWHDVGQGPIHDVREEELLARTETEGSEAINWHSVGHNLKEFGQGLIHDAREDELIARGFVWSELD